jgi:urease accessory protein
MNSVNFDNLVCTVLDKIVDEHSLPATGKTQVRAQLRLTFAYQQDRQQTRLITCEQSPPLQVVRAFSLPDGAALAHLHNLSGGVLGGDQLALAVNVGPQASVQLTSTGATRLYRCRPQMSAASQTTTVQVQEGGLLEYLPDQLIPFAGARYHQYSTIDLADDAGLFWWETVAPGRAARGELFAYDQLHLSTRIAAQGRPLAIERFTLEPQCKSLSSLARLGPYKYFCSLYICRVGLDAARWLKLERTLNTLAYQISTPDDISWGVSCLVAHGLVVRGVSCQGYKLTAGLLKFWQEAKLALYGREAIPPRKIY